MSRAVYIGGFGEGKTLVDDVRTAYAATYGFEDIDAFTFAAAMNNPDKVRRAAQGVPALTHSAGLLALLGSRPAEITAVAAPLPSSRTKLIGRTMVKTAHMTQHALNGPDARHQVLRYDASSVAELGAHLYGNIRHLGAIARADSIGIAVGAQEAGIHTDLVFHDQDDYFSLTDADRHAASMHQVNVVEISGQHDQLPLYPAQTLQQIQLAQIR